MRRKYAGAGIAALMVGVLATGCTATSGGGGGDGETIRVLAQVGSPGDALAALAEQYTEENPGVTVEVELLPYNSVYERTILDANTGDSSYDVIGFDHPWLPEYLQAGILQPIDDFVTDADELDDFIPSYVDLSSSDGALYGLPWLGAVEMMYYRTDVFEELGLEVPDTWEEYREAARIITEQADMLGTTMIGMRNSALHADLAPLIIGYGGAFTEGDPERAALESPEVKAAVEMYASLYPYAQADALSADWGQAASLFAQGAAGMSLNFSDTTPLLFGSGSAIEGKVGYAVYPQGPTGERAPWLGGWSLGISASTDADKAAKAFDFMSWALAAQQQYDTVALGGSPTRISVLEDEGLIAEYPWFPAQLESYLIGYSPHYTVDFVERESAWVPPVAEIIQGTVSIDEGLAESAARLNDVLDGNN